jgi:hypothetical protein
MGRRITIAVHRIALWGLMAIPWGFYAGCAYAHSIVLRIALTGICTTLFWLIALAIIGHAEYRFGKHL